MRREGLLVVQITVLSLLVAAPIVAQEEREPAQPEGQAAEERAPEETARQPVLGVARSSGGARSLAALARSVSLGNGTSGEGVEITNSNIKELRGGAFSVSGGTAGGPAPGGEEEPDAAQGPNLGVMTPEQQVLQRQYEQQLAEVEAIEKGLADFDARVAEQRAQPYATTYAQNRSPGTVNGNDLIREGVQSQLEAERAQLEALRAKAEEHGYELRGPETEQGSGGATGEQDED